MYKRTKFDLSAAFFHCLYIIAAGESSFTVNEKLLNSSEPSPVLASSEVFDWVKEALRHCLTKPIESDRQECILAILLLAVEAAKENRRVLDLEKCRAMHTETKRFLSELPNRTLPGIEGLTDDLCDKLVPRIVVAALMMTKPDSRLEQLSKCTL